MKSLLILDGHPDPSDRHLCHALASAYRKGAANAGHRSKLIRMAEVDFPILRIPSDFTDRSSPPALQPARDALLEVDHLVLVYPLWLGTLPAFTKGFLEQLLHYETAFERAETDRWPKGKMVGKSARIVLTTGMPAFAYNHWYRAHSLKSLKRNILGFVGFKPIRSTVLGMVEQASPDKVEQWLEKMEMLGQKAI